MSLRQYQYKSEAVSPLFLFVTVYCLRNEKGMSMEKAELKKQLLEECLKVQKKAAGTCFPNL